ncbi:MAG: hypothetical protein Kow0092_05190 [Deferrisomatales bacterium]
MRHFQKRAGRCSIRTRWALAFAHPSADARWLPPQNGSKSATCSGFAPPRRSTRSSLSPPTRFPRPPTLANGSERW